MLERMPAGEQPTRRKVVELTETLIAARPLDHPTGSDYASGARDALLFVLGYAPFELPPTDQTETPVEVAPSAMKKGKGKKSPAAEATPATEVPEN